MTEMTKTRPKFLNLAEIRLPIAGYVSILHRVSGAGLFLALPFLLCLLQLSLGSAEDFSAFKGIVGHPLAKLVLFGLSWAYMHHFCAGIRFLLLDLHIGIDIAKLHRLVRRRDEECAASGFAQCFEHRRRATAIGVGLDDARHIGIRHFAKHAVIAGKRAKIDG